MRGDIDFVEWYTLRQPSVMDDGSRYCRLLPLPSEINGCAKFCKQNPVNRAIKIYRGQHKFLTYNSTIE